MPLISQSLKGSDLSPLFLHHSCHSGQTDQRRHKKENRRENLADSSHPVCIFSISAVFRQIGPVVYKPFRFFQILNFLFRIRQLLFCVFDFLLSVRDFLPGFCFPFIILIPAVRDFLLCVCQLRLRIRQFLLPGFNLRPSVVNLLLGRFQPGLRGLNLSVCLADGLLSLLNFLIKGIHRRESHLIRLSAGRKSIVLLLCFIERIDLVIECINIRVQLFFSPVQFFLPVYKLLSGRFQLLSG